ncbi:MAG: PQ-loop repeat-containing protein, partial [Acidimicrobiia bacterium]|nr:PQ-loop repeat-containing protein [Acidimicrobiia bacterium]
MLADVTGYVATLFSMAFIWPQVVRAHRRNTVEGLAPLGQVIGSVATVLWGVYSYFT